MTDEYQLYPDGSAVLVPCSPQKGNAPGPHTGPYVPNGCACSLKTADVTKLCATFEIARPEINQPNALAVNPVLPLVAIVDSKGLRVCDARTGRVLDDKLNSLPEEPFRVIRRLAWSPNGRTLLVDSDTRFARLLRPVTMKLTDQESKAVQNAMSAPPPKLVPAPAPKTPSEDALPSRKDLDSLTIAQPKESFTRCLVQVCLGQTLWDLGVPNNNCSPGVCVGKSGYVVTASGNLPALGNPTIQYYDKNAASPPSGTHGPGGRNNPRMRLRPPVLCPARQNSSRSARG